MPASYSKRKKRAVNVSKPKTPNRKKAKDWRFRTRVIGKSHDPRDIYHRRRVDDLDLLTKHYMEDNF